MFGITKKANVERHFKTPLIKRNKPFKDGEIIKEDIKYKIKASFHDFKNKKEILSSINVISPSRKTQQRIKAIGKNLEDSLNMITCGNVVFWHCNVNMCEIFCTPSS